MKVYLLLFLMSSRLFLVISIIFDITGKMDGVVIIFFIQFISSAKSPSQSGFFDICAYTRGYAAGVREILLTVIRG